MDRTGQVWRVHRYVSDGSESYQGLQFVIEGKDPHFPWQWRCIFLTPPNPDGKVKYFSELVLLDYCERLS